MFDELKETDTGLLCPANSCGGSGRVLVLGLGNILLRDEGAGVHAAQELQKQSLPGNVEVIDGGTAGLEILLSQQCPYKLLVIDATKAGNEPGTIYKIRLKFSPDFGLKRSFSGVKLTI